MSRRSSSHSPLALKHMHSDKTEKHGKVETIKSFLHIKSKKSVRNDSLANSSQVHSPRNKSSSSQSPDRNDDDERDASGPYSDSDNEYERKIESKQEQPDKEISSDNRIFSALPLDSIKKISHPMQLAREIISDTKVSVAPQTDSPRNIPKQLQLDKDTISTEIKIGDGPKIDSPKVFDEVKVDPVVINTNPVSFVEREPFSGKAEIAIIGIKEKGNELHSFRQRGFVVHIATRRAEKTLDVALGIGPKLLAILIVEEGILFDGSLSRSEQMKLSVAGIDVLKRIPQLEFEDIFLLHEKESKEYLNSHSSPDDIADYFGSEIGMYFAFLKFYTHFLRIPAIGGAVLFIGQIFSGYRSTLGPVFCIGLALWSTLFLQYWKRHCSAMTLRWGIYGAENEENIQELANSSEGHKRTPVGRMMVSLHAILLSIYIAIRVMLFCLWLSESAEEIYGKSSLLRFLPVIVYSIVPVLFSAGYTVLATKLNDFEGHRTDAIKSRALTLKLFAFQFINFFCALFYIAFWLLDMPRLSSMLFSLAVTKQVVGNALEVGMPIVKQRIREWRINQAISKIYNKKSSSAKIEPVTNVIPNEGIAPTIGKILDSELKSTQDDTEVPESGPILGPVLLNEDVLTLKEFESQLNAENFQPSDEYLEMAVQFGFSTMFAVAFPLAPLFAYLNNQVEYKVDFQKLLQARRPIPRVATSIGGWYLCLEGMGFIATLTNCCLMVLLDDALDYCVPSFFGISVMGRIEMKLVIALVLEHLLLAIKFLIGGIIQEDPRWVRIAVAKKEVEEKKSMKKMMERVEVMRSEAQIDPEEMIIEPLSVPPSPQDSSKWEFGVVWFAPLIMLPYLIVFFKLGPSLVFLVSALIIYFLKHQKNRADFGVALGVISDSSVLKLILKEYPSWFYESDVHKADWMNKLLKHIWIHVSGAAEIIVKDTIEPMLDYYRPKGVTRLGFSEVSLGTIPPKIIGIRTICTNKDSATLDIEIKWAGNPKFVIEAGQKGMPLVVRLKNIVFNGKMRVELRPLTEQLPCFEAIVITCMERPYINFAFKVGGLDVMSVGPGDLSIANAVSNVIKYIIQELMLYPKKLVIPMVDNVDVNAIANPSPIGILQVNLIGADNLRKADLMGQSDPYVVMKLGETVIKTNVVKNTLNPRWNQKFDFFVHDKIAQIISFRLYDEDIDTDDELGNCEIPLSALSDHRVTPLNILLCDTSTGSLLLKLKYIPLQIPDKEYDISAVKSGKYASDSEESDTQSDDGYLDSEESDTDEESELIAPPPEEKPKGPLLKAVRNSLRFGKVPSVMAPNTELPHVNFDLKGLTIGVLTIMDLDIRIGCSARMYCIIQQDSFVSQTAIAPKSDKPSWPIVHHIMINDFENASLEFIVMKKRAIGNDTLVGSCKHDLVEIFQKRNCVSKTFPLINKVSTVGGLKFRAAWRAAEQE